jgi:hypothetical protein
VRFCCSSQLTAVTCAEDSTCCFAAPIAEYRTLPSAAGFTVTITVAVAVAVAVTVTAGFTSVSIAS